MGNNKKALILILFGLVLVNVFKIMKLNIMPLWHDESFSALLIQYDFKEMIYRISLDVHPPLYYVLLKGWAFIFGGMLFSIRMFSLFFGGMTVLASYVLIKKLFSHKLALLSSILLALSSFQIQYDMEARMYTLGAFFIVVSSFFLVRGLQSPRWRYWLPYALFAAAGIYTHYYVFFWIAGQVVFTKLWILKESGFSVKQWFKNKNVRLGLVSYLLIALSFVPWLKVFLQQLNQVQASYWIPLMNAWSIPNTFLSMTTGGSVDPSRQWWLLAVLMLFVLIAFIYFLKKTGPFAKWLLFLLILIPFVLSALLSLKASIYLDRYFIFALPFYLAILSGAILSIDKKLIRNILVAIAILGMLLSFPLRWLSFEIEKKPGMAGASEFLNREVKTDDKIFVGSSFVFFTFKYYNETGTKPLLYAPGELLHYSGTALLTEDDVIADFNKETKSGDIVWMINTTGFGNYKPTVPENWEKLQEQGFQDTYDYRGWIVITEYQTN